MTVKDHHKNKVLILIARIQQAIYCKNNKHNIISSVCGVMEGIIDTGIKVRDIFSYY